MTDTPLAEIPQYTIIDTPENEPKDPKTNEPPKRGPGRPPGGGSSKTKKTPLPPWKDGVISSFMTSLYDTAGDLLLPYSEPYGYAFKAIAENCGNAWEACAKDSPALRRFIHSLMSASNFSKLAAAHMPLFIVALHQHGPLRQVTDDLAAEYDSAA